MQWIALLPPTNLFVPFMLAGLALNLTPGPDMSFVALAGAKGGKKAGVFAVAGIFIECLGHIVFAVAGLDIDLGTAAVRRPRPVGSSRDR